MIFMGWDGSGLGNTSQPTFPTTGYFFNITMVSALTVSRYGNMALRAGYRRYRYTPRGRAVYIATRAAGAAYRNRKSLKRAARVVQRAWRSRKKARTSPSIRQVSKVKGNIANVASGLAAQTLTFHEIVFPSMETDNQEYAQRSGPYLWVNSMKVCAKFTNLLATTGLDVHFAMVQAKGTNSSSSQISDDLFTNPYASNQRLASFPAASTAYNHELECYTLNSTKWNIIFHKRFTLDGKGTATGQMRDGRFMKDFHIFKKINKRIMFEFPSSDHPEKTWWLLIWCQQNDVTTTQEIVNPVLDIKMNTRVYFK